MRIFQNYHKHTTYTNPRIADSTATNYDFFKRATELNHGIISIMEHGYQGRYIEGYELSQLCINKKDCDECNSCKNNKNKDCYKHLIFVSGVEAYWVKDRFEKDRANCHIYIGAINENGRRAINSIVSEANVTGFYGTARVDEELILSLPKDDVIVTTACIAFWKYDDVEDFVYKLNNHFSHFFLEVQYHNTESQKELNRKIISLKEKYNIPLIMGCDSHYIFEKDKKERDNYILSRGISYPEEDGWYLDYPDGDTAYLRFIEQAVLNESQIEESIENTNIFLSVEEYNCPCFNKEIKMPIIFPNLAYQERQCKLETLVWEKWKKEKTKISKELYNIYEQEIEKELDIINEVKHADYFLDDYYTVKRAKEKGGVLTPSGRGSAVSFYVNKLLGFTKVDRISAAVKMYPERFMSPTRMLESKTLADIDMNEANPEVFLEAQKEVFGENSSFPMLAYGTLKPKAAWKMYSRSQNLDFEVSNDISSQIERYENAVKSISEDEKDLVSIYDYIDKEFHDMFEESKKYQGIIDSFSIHPCSSLVYSGDIRSEIGLIKIKDNLCCLMDGHWAEDYKFLKNDHLKVNVVKLIDRVFKRLNIEMFDVEHLLKLCENNNKVWDIYKKSATMGINQVEQKATKVRVAKYAPKNISELCAFVAAIRPGFKSMYPIFERRESFSYGIKALDDIIQTPQMKNSFILYQEIQMSILNYAGIPLSECYNVIKNIAKKRTEKVLSYKEQFINGFKYNIIEKEHESEENAEKLSHKIWQIMEDSARYSFNACLSKDTKIYRPILNKNSFYPTIEQMFRIKNDKEYAKSVGQYELYKKYNTYGYGYALSLFSDGLLKKNKIVDIRYSGKQQTYIILTEKGKEIKVTSNHKFPTCDGIKECRDLKIGDYLYVKGSHIKNSNNTTSNIEKIISISQSDIERVYDLEMDSPNHNFVVDSGIVTSNSHSYCVAIDSLYGAYLKATYPLEFYTEFLILLEEDSDKSRILLVKEEAQDIFGIKFPPFRFGQDNRNITCNKKTNEINTSLKTIKRFGKNVSEILFDAGKKNFDSFVDCLIYLDSTFINKTQIETLILIDYFSEFGNSKQLYKIYDVFKFLKCGESKTLSLDKQYDTLLENIIKRHSRKTEKQYKDINSYNVLLEWEEFILNSNLEDFTIGEKIKIQKKLLGYVSFKTGKLEDRTKLIIVEVKELISKKSKKLYAYRFKTTSLGSGKNGEVCVWANNYLKNEVKEGQVINVNPKLLYQDEYNGNKTWWLKSYEIIDI